MYLSLSTKYFVMYLGTSRSTSTILKLNYKQVLEKMYLSTDKYKYRCAPTLVRGEISVIQC